MDPGAFFYAQGCLERLLSTLKITAGIAHQAQMHPAEPILIIRVLHSFFQSGKPAGIDNISFGNGQDIGSVHFSGSEKTQPRQLAVVQSAFREVVPGGQPVLAIHDTALLFQTAPSGTHVDHRAGFSGDGLHSVQDVSGAMVKCIIQCVYDGFLGGIPVSVELFGTPVQRTISLGPGIDTAGFQGNMLQLSAAQTGLDLYIACIVTVRKEVLPVVAAVAVTPDEQLPTKEIPRGTLDHANTVFVHGCDPLGGAVGDIEEEILRDLHILGIGNVDASANRDVSEIQIALGFFCIVDEGFGSGNDDAHTIGVGNSDVGPPIGPDVMIGGIFDSGADKQHPGIFGKPCIEAVGRATNALILIHTDTGGSICHGDVLGKHVCTGHGMMTAN